MKNRMKGCFLLHELLEVNPSHDIMTLGSLEKVTASWLSQANPLITIEFYFPVKHFLLLLSKHDPQTLL